MLVETSESIFSPLTLLWLAAAAIAALILFGSMHRRKSGLTDSLRQYVDQSQQMPRERPASGETNEPADS